MKRIISFIFLPLLLAGCVNLDFTESDSLSSAALATNPAAAVYTTDGIYSMMKDMVYFRGVISDQNTFVRRYFMMSEIKSDNICFSNTSTDAFWTSATYMDDENSSDAAYLWLICYKAIYAANANISGLAEDTAQNRQLKGENHFLRAFFHFTLCDFFAKPYTLGAGAENLGVILRIGIDYDPNPVRASLGDCYDAIEQDLLEAIRYERRVELCVEAVNYFDEIRWGTYKQTKFQGKTEYGGQSWWGCPMTQNMGIWYYDECMWPWSAPLAEIQRNHNLTRRPGWSY